MLTGNVYDPQHAADGGADVLVATETGCRQEPDSV